MSCDYGIFEHNNPHLWPIATRYMLVHLGHYTLVSNKVNCSDEIGSTRTKKQNNNPRTTINLYECMLKAYYFLLFFLSRLAHRYPFQPTLNTTLYTSHKY